MGSISFSAGAFCEVLSEAAGYKAGLALSVDDLCRILHEPHYVKLIRESEQFGVRIRSEDFEPVFHRLLHRVGFLEDDYEDGPPDAPLRRKYSDRRETYDAIWQLFATHYRLMIDEAEKSKSDVADPERFLRAAADAEGKLGLDIAMDVLSLMNKRVMLGVHSKFRPVIWTNRKEIAEIFGGSSAAPEGGKFIDQRFLDYLSVNHQDLCRMHWRLFEQLTAEYFHREGYDVQLGPGSNDDGVDVRVWYSDRNRVGPPQFIVQCKREKSKIEKVVVKGLFADIVHERAEYGLIVTTSQLSPGARSTIEARGYPIKEVNRDKLRNWLIALRSPGTGIVRR